MTAWPENLCANCRWWDAGEERLDGLCRVFAPRLSGQACPHGNGFHQDPQRAMWPVTRCDDWCGGFLPTPPAQAGEGQ